MKLVMEGQPLLIPLAVWTCVAVFVISFLGMLCSIYLALTKTGALVTRPDERALHYWERAARKNSRVSSILTQSKFKHLRCLMFSAIAGAFASFGGLLLIIGFFGTRT